MKKDIFYQRFANTPLPKRFEPLPFDMTLQKYYEEIHDIDNKIRADEIRRELLLKEVEPFLMK